MRFRCISKLGNLQAYFSTLVSFEIHEWRTLFSNIQLGPSMQACVNDVPWKDPLKRQFRDTQWRDLIGFLQWKDPAGSFQVSSHSKGSFRKFFPLHCSFHGTPLAKRKTPMEKPSGSFTALWHHWRSPLYILIASRLRLSYSNAL